MMEAKKLHFSRGDKTILQDVSFSILKGEVLAVLGPNGSGKSTILHMLSGTLKPDSGKIILDAENLAQLSALEQARKRAVLQQAVQVNFPFLVEEIVMLGRTPHLQGAESEKDYSIMQQAIARVHGEDLKGRRFPSLSGGEQQRIQFARVLAQLEGIEAGYLLLDEPTSALDPKHQHAILKEARKLAGEGHGVCAILHDLNLAMLYADKVLLLKEGRVMSFGTTAEIMTADTISELFEVPVMEAIASGRKMLIPASA